MPLFTPYCSGRSTSNLSGSDALPVSKPKSLHRLIGVIGITAKTAPDKRKTGQVCLGERFMIQEDRQQELHSWCNVLKGSHCH
jgi:hypothetical protein